MCADGKTAQRRIIGTLEPSTKTTRLSCNCIALTALSIKRPPRIKYIPIWRTEIKWKRMVCIATVTVRGVVNTESS